MKFSMLAIAATAFAGVQGFAPVANPSARVMAMQVRRFPIGCFGWLIECSLQNEKMATLDRSVTGILWHLLLHCMCGLVM